MDRYSQKISVGESVAGAVFNMVGKFKLQAMYIGGKENLNSSELIQTLVIEL